MSKHIAIAGATGAVGLDLLRCLEKRDFPLGKLTLHLTNAVAACLYFGKEGFVRLLDFPVMDRYSRDERVVLYWWCHRRSINEYFLLTMKVQYRQKPPPLIEF